MQRHKANVEVKQAIVILCKLMTSTGLLHVPAPETFRRAKYGEHNAEDEFWQLLANILQTKTVSPTGGTLTKDVSLECKILVSTGLWKSGYYAGWLYDREVKGVSSRELLLALGWLLAAGMLEKLLIQRVQQLDKTLLPPVLVLSHSQSSRSSSSGQSSPALKKICNDVQQLSDVFELYLKWKELENVFWTWMDSVVDLHEKDPVTERPTHIMRGDVNCNAGQLALDKLDNILLRLETLQWKGQETGKVDKEDRKGRLQDDLDICSDALLESLPPRISVSQAYRPRFLTRKTVKSSSVKSFQGTVDEADELPVSEVVELLAHTERQLLDARDTQRFANKMQLQELIGRLDKLLLIPP
ncbi:tubulin epsilon and delta complex protein 1-like isoform X2 [Corythoichthys intestinalis]|uniref:tubulin epsilon and delta complex protein 1-like isoform X2 n=1 Tax=Corythoichthys intestinalis TaxID=161448 RepID=UPI0025A4FD69|nr:tubulin epsilon and delta complex protein 1-like isoform X2 [Corythoichthys intestinalis]